MSKILLDTRWLTEKPTGVGWYIHEIAQRLVKEHEFKCTFLGGTPEKLPQEGIKIPLPNWKKKLYQGLWKTIKFPSLNTLGGKQDLIHFTNGLAIPHHYTKNLITVHDLAFVDFPEMIESKNLSFLKKTVPWSLQQATHLIAVSKETKKDIIKHFHIPEKNISVVYNGIDEIFFKTPSAEKLAHAQEKYNLPKKFFLSVSTIEPRKNFSTMIEGYNLLPKEIQDEYDLVIVGSKGWQNEYEKMKNLIETLNLSKKIHLLGYTDFSDLPAMYALATAYLHTSVKEGFGIGLAQSLAMGVPLISSETSCHPEIASDAALYYETKNPGDLAKKIIQLLNEKSATESRVTRGKEIAKKYSWEKAAEETAKIYRSLLS